jgi:hypothetical protein
MSISHNSPEVQELGQLISALGGPDYTRVMSGVRRTRTRFTEIREELDQLIVDTGPDTVRFASNTNVYTEEGPVETAVFAYCDVSTGGDLLAQIMEVRAIVINELETTPGPRLRLSSLGEQHVTLFIDMMTHSLSRNDITASQQPVAEKYVDLIGQCTPVTVRLRGPYLTATGALILEGDVYSDQILKLRDAATRNLQHVPPDAERRIYDIVHTSIGYVVEASRDQLISLRSRLTAMREAWEICSVRVREVLVGVSLNKALIGTPLHIRFGRARPLSLSQEGTIAALSGIRKLSASWGHDPDLRNIVVEEALYWSEYPKASSEVRRLAAEIASCSA